MIDPAHPFFKPAWRRYLTIAVTLAWAAVEWGFGNDGVFQIIATAFAAASLWYLLISWKGPPPDVNTLPK